MKKIVLLLRHGESADKQANQTDFERILSARGVESIIRLRDKLIEENLFPQLVVSSDSVRTKQTVEHLFGDSSLNNSIQYYHSLYNGGNDQYWEVLQDTQTNIVMVVGHNPSVSSMIGLLTGSMPEALHAGQVAVIEFQEQITLNGGRLAKFLGPFL